MFRDDYRDDYARERDYERSRPLYPRDIRDPYFDDLPPARDRLYEGERDRMRPYPLDSFRGSPREPLLSDLEPRSIVRGGAIIIPPPSYEAKPKKRDKPRSCDTVFVGSLPDNVQEKHLYDIFIECGRIDDVRISRGRNFGHVQFAKCDDSVDKAVELSGYRIRIGPAGQKDTSKIHVDYALPKGELEVQKRIQENETLVFNIQNASTVSSDLHREDAFCYAAKNVTHWLEKGNCNQSTSNTFFGLISSINTHCRKLAKTMSGKQEDLEEFRKKQRNSIMYMQKDCKILEELFEVATQQKAWDHFTKPQRKSIQQWKDYATDVQKDVTRELEGKDEKESGEPPAKRTRVDEEGTDAQLQQTEQMVEKLKVALDQTREKKDREILQLKTLLARFKQSYPEEWEKAIGIKPTENGKDGEEGKSQEGASDGKMVDGVDLSDLKKLLSDGGGESNSLAAAAAAYAQMRTVVGGGSEPSGLGLTEDEVAIVTVLATFLTVHPLGAAIAEMNQYMQTFNPNSNGYYLESLLRRLPQVFQLSQSPEGEPKWWFLGFQTCCDHAQYSATKETEEGRKGGSPKATVKKETR